MKISIDTKEDSHEDMRKLISMLQHIVGGKQEYSTVFDGTSGISPPAAEQSVEPVAPGLFSIFDETPSEPAAAPSAPDDDADTGSPEEEEPENIQLMTYE
ncbi:MAG: hypothetical protein GXP63_01660 [DPANN group archaeon]|nr:hypothetical protein [DPANN group archaeon]